MRLQIASDLHLETRPKQTFETILTPSAPCLALLGDIAPLDHPNLRRFLEWCSERWETILYVPGKSECFTEPKDSSQAPILRQGLPPRQSEPYQDIQTSVDTLKMICSTYENIHVLYRDSFYSEDGVLILGCPFWSFDPYQPKYIQKLHRADLTWIQSMTKSYTNPILILSHFGPVSWVQYEHELIDPRTSPIFTETELLLRNPITTWAFGHCHTYIEYSKVWGSANGIPQTVLLVCNGMGPRPTKETAHLPISDYQSNAVLGIDPSLYLPNAV